MFEATRPASAAELMRLDDFEADSRAGALDDDDNAEVVSGGTRLSALNPSLLQDLQRFGAAAEHGAGIELLEVMAAALRHARPLLLHVQIEARVLPMTVWPTHWRLQSPLSLPELLNLRLQELRLLSVQPARDAEPLAADGFAGLPSLFRHAGSRTKATAALAEGPPQSVSALRPLLWELALRGSRKALLPEIDGIATYRVAPGAELRSLELQGSLHIAVQRLQRQTTPLRHIATFDGFDPDRAARLLNALYLQAALMISRSDPLGICDPHAP